MKILLVAATEQEVERLRTDLSEKFRSIDVLVTGAGIAATTYALTRKLMQQHYQYVINLGLAGSFRQAIQIGDVVHIVSETFADLGAEDDKNFLSLFELGLANQDEFPFWNGKLKNESAGNFDSLSQLKQVKGITVNSVHGRVNSILRVVKKFQPDIESMEGAAVFFVCMMEKVPFLEVRAISNKVETRSRDTWNIPMALDNLKTVVLQLLTEMK